MTRNKRRLLVLLVVLAGGMRLTSCLAKRAKASPRSPASFELAHRLMQRAVKQRAFESGVLLVARRGKVLYHRAYGSATRDSIFDLASLTKPLATTTTLMRLVDAGKLTPSTELGQLLPSAAGGPLARTPICRLLDHRSGLPARNNLAQLGRGLQPAAARGCFERRITRTEPRPGANKTLYSDLNMMLAGWAAERAGARPLDHLARELVFKPLGLRKARFIRGPPPSGVVATERVGRQRLRGVVHDAKARALGGVAGHAGMFASASDVQRIVDALVGAYHGRRSIFTPETVRAFLDAGRANHGPRALGWDRPAKDGATGRLFAGRNAIGHLGFTGTSVWVDLDRELSVVLLTNRVYHGRDPKQIRRYRPLIHDAVGRALEHGKP